MRRQIPSIPARSDLAIPSTLSIHTGGEGPKRASTSVSSSPCRPVLSCPVHIDRQTTCSAHVFGATHTIFREGGADMAGVQVLPRNPAANVTISSAGRSGVSLWKDQPPLCRRIGSDVVPAFHESRGDDAKSAS